MTKSIRDSYAEILAKEQERVGGDVDKIDWKKLFNEAERIKLHYIKEFFIGSNFEIDLKNGRIFTENLGKGMLLNGDTLSIGNPISGKTMLVLDTKNQEIYFGNIPPMKLNWNKFIGPSNFKVNCGENSIQIKTDSLLTGTVVVSYEKLAKNFFNLMEIKGDIDFYKKNNFQTPINLGDFFLGFNFSELIK